MKRKLQGRYVVTSTLDEKVESFIPLPLPPKPSINWTPELLSYQQEASMALGRLDSISEFLPDKMPFLYSYVRKEAVLSSQIEGTQSSLSDLLFYENNAALGVPLGDVIEVSHYVKALEHGIKRIDEGFPLSLRFIKEIHKELLSHGRGSHKQPGEFRSSQNWIGGTRPGNAVYVPPPPTELLSCLNSFEKYLHGEPIQHSSLVKAALAHVQFETLHPFLDGNGRVGRLLITLILYYNKTIQHPLLYLSLFFKQHKQYYYELLQQVRINGVWEKWLEFFFEGVIKTANQAVNTAKKLLELFKHDQELIHTLQRASVTAIQIHELFTRQPVLSANRLVKVVSKTPASVNKGLKNLIKLNIIKEISGQKRNRLFCYKSYLDTLNNES